MPTTSCCVGSVLEAPLPTLCFLLMMYHRCPQATAFIPWHRISFFGQQELVWVLLTARAHGGHAIDWAAEGLLGRFYIWNQKTSPSRSLWATAQNPASGNESSGSRGAFIVAVWLVRILIIKLWSLRPQNMRAKLWPSKITVSSWCIIYPIIEGHRNLWRSWFLSFESSSSPLTFGSRLKRSTDQGNHLHPCEGFQKQSNKREEDIWFVEKQYLIGSF